MKKYYLDYEAFDEAFCEMRGCNACAGTGLDGEPNGYGCEAREKWVDAEIEKTGEYAEVELSEFYYRVADVDAKLARQDALLEEAKDLFLQCRKALLAFVTSLSYTDPDTGLHIGILATDVLDILKRLTSRNHSEVERGDEYCEWRCLDSDIMLYGGSCGCEWIFDDPPTGDSYNFCPKCGKPIHLISESFDQRNPHPPSGVIEDGNKE